MIRSALALVALTGMIPDVVSGQEAAAEAIADRLPTVTDPDVIRLYQTRQFAPLWLDAGTRLNPAGRQALDLLRQSTHQGLDSSLYDVPRLGALLANERAESADSVRAEIDLLLSGGIMRFLRDLRQGRARPASLPPDSSGPDLVLAVASAAAADSLAELERAMSPPFRQYRLLQAALARERTALEAAPGDTAAIRRVTQLRLALERLRWVPRNVHGRMIVVNVPSFELLAFDTPDGSPRLELRSKVIVGTAERNPTPLLFDEMTMVEFWPWWNVPRSILLREILPGLRRNPDYLRSRGMEIVNTRDQVMGDRATPELLQGLADGSLGVRQRPSRANALGVVKFLFPNTASVYAHDTPDRELFERARRDFSHGCIRVEEAASLAQWVMAQEPGWAPDQVQAALRGPATRRVQLRQAIPILIVYTTAEANPDGTVRYLDDLYGLDGPLAASLQH
ncbi:MAG TPA: L,D-transpeptidase family protein [Gemmatimonadales bacterium]|nr:L,D-transpeptidase family protein [Gemmatimonadales bacterium]